MVSGIKLAVQGMTFQMNRQDQIANNLANQSTIGFKQSGVFSSTMEKHLSSTPEGVDPDRQIRTDELYIDYSEGAMAVTANDLDLAIKGTGFFSVLTDSGVSRYGGSDERTRRPVSGLTDQGPPSIARRQGISPGLRRRRC